MNVNDDRADDAMDANALAWTIVVVILTALLGFTAFVITDAKKSAKAEKAKVEKVQALAKAAAPAPAAPKPKTTHAEPKKSKKPKDVEHERLLAAMKGFTEPITSVSLSSDNKLCAAASADRSIRVWPGLDKLGGGGPLANPLRANVELDHASALSFSANGTNLVAGIAQARGLLAFAVKVPPAAGAGLELKKTLCAKAAHSTPMVATLLAANGRFIVTAAGGDDEHVKLWSLSGECLCTHANKQGEIFSAALSVDSRFVALGCWMSDVKVLKVTTAKDGAPTGLETAMTCTGQRRACTSVAFSDDCTQLAACSKDGSWSVWRIDVRYEYKEDPRLRGRGAAPDGVPFERVALSPRGSLLAASVGADIHLLAVDGVHHASATALAVIAGAHPGGVRCLAFGSDGTRFASGGADGRVRLWKAADAADAGAL